MELLGSSHWDQAPQKAYDRLKSGRPLVAAFFALSCA
jgi:hypothetical protein